MLTSLQCAVRKYLHQLSQNMVLVCSHFILRCSVIQIGRFLWSCAIFVNNKVLFTRMCLTPLVCRSMYYPVYTFVAQSIGSCTIDLTNIHETSTMMLVCADSKKLEIWVLLSYNLQSTEDSQKRMRMNLSLIKYNKECPSSYGLFQSSQNKLLYTYSLFVNPGKCAWKYF